MVHKIAVKFKLFIKEMVHSSAEAQSYQLRYTKVAG